MAITTISSIEPVIETLSDDDKIAVGRADGSTVTATIKAVSDSVQANNTISVYPSPTDMVDLSSIISVQTGSWKAKTDMMLAWSTSSAGEAPFSMLNGATVDQSKAVFFETSSMKYNGSASMWYKKIYLPKSTTITFTSTDGYVAPLVVNYTSGTNVNIASNSYEISTGSSGTTSIWSDDTISIYATTTCVSGTTILTSVDVYLQNNSANSIKVCIQKSSTVKMVGSNATGYDSDTIDAQTKTIASNGKIEVAHVSSSIPSKYFPVSLSIGTLKLAYSSVPAFSDFFSAES